MIGLELGIIVIFSLLNGVFAMSEAAVISARRTRLQQLADAGNDGAKAALAMAEHPARFLSTVQIGITLIGILSGAFGGATVAEEIGALLAQVPLLAPYAEVLGVALVVLSVTYLSLVVGELVPKRIALQNAEAIAVRVARPMSRLSRVTAPLIWLLTASTDLALRLLGVRPPQASGVTVEDVEAMVREGAETGVIEKTAQTMVMNVLRLDEVDVSDAMTPRTEVVWLDLNDTPEENRRKIAAHVHSAFPVCRGSLDNVVGLVLSRELLKRSLSDLPFDLQAVLHEPLFLPENMPAPRALELIKQYGAHIGLVVNEYGGVEGLVTVKDLVEEVVGALEANEAVQRSDGSWLLDGLMHVEDARKKLGIEAEFPGEAEGYFTTLGGFVMARLGRIPALSDVFLWDGWRFEVVDMDGRRVDKVLVDQVGGGEMG